MKKRSLSLLVLCLLALPCQNFGMDMDEDPRFSSLVLPDDSISKINDGKITAQGIEFSPNKEISITIENPRGACLVYSEVHRTVFDATSEDYYKPLRNLNPNAHSTDKIFLLAEPTKKFANLGKFNKDLLEKIQKALNGDSAAQVDIGTILYEQDNIAEATSWFEKAAINNNSVAMYKLGMIFENLKNHSFAISMYQSAQLFGNKDAILALARIYRSEENIMAALEYYEMYHRAHENQNTGSI